MALALETTCEGTKPTVIGDSKAKPKPEWPMPIENTFQFVCVPTEAVLGMLLTGITGAGPGMGHRGVSGVAICIGAGISSGPGICIGGAI